MEHSATEHDSSARLAPKLLPRLSYVGEVPVEFSYHGSTLLARLLEEYPRGRLQVVEGINQSLPERRLRDVAFVQCDVPLGRLRTTRFASMASFALALGARISGGCALTAATTFRPDAILTVAHGTYWLVAARVSRLLGVPLHLIIHDHVPLTVFGGSRLRKWVEERFAEIYRSAASRLCVSPYMERRYSELYGAPGQVLYPARARTTVVHDAPPERRDVAAGALTGVFAGTINTPNYASAIVGLAKALDRVGGRILLYGPISREAGNSAKLTAHNIELRGLVEAGELSIRCRHEADFLFVPMSFADGDRTNMELAFPSKLTDYTAMGLPLLIHGPDYCSAVRWARDNPEVAIVVDDERPGALDQAVGMLTSWERRAALGRKAISVGHDYFGYERAQSVFNSALMSCG